MKRILWLSQHKIQDFQIAELYRLFGEDIEILTDYRAFDTADEIVRRINDIGADEVIVVAPLSVIKELTDREIKPLWSQMDVVTGEDYDLVYRGRKYKFTGFKRIKKVWVEYEEI